MEPYCFIQPVEKCTWNRGAGQPTPDEGRLVRPVVVEDDVDVQRPRDGRVDPVQEGAELASRGAGASRRSRSGSGIKRRKQRGRPVLLVVKRALSVPLTQCR